MNITLDSSIIITLLVNAVFIVLGILIKNELHDIKARIVRLENLFLHPTHKEKLEHIVVPIFLVLVCAFPSISYAQRAVIGGAVDSPTETITGILCETGCPVFFDVQNSNPSLVVGGSTCMYSEAGGQTGSWVPCATNPPDGPVIQGIGVTDTGAFIVAQSTGVGVCNIYRSTNKGASWDLRYTETTSRTCRNNQVNVGNMALCNGIDCAVATFVPPFGAPAGAAIGVLRSLDDGVNWVPLLGAAPSAFSDYTTFMEGIGQWDLRAIDRAIIAGANAAFSATSLTGIGTLAASPFYFSVGGCLTGAYKESVARFIVPCYDAFSNTIYIEEPTSTFKTPSIPNIPLGLTASNNRVAIADVGGETYLFGKQATVFGGCDTGEGVGIFRMVTYNQNVSTTWTQEDCQKVQMPFTVTSGQVKVVNDFIYVLLSNGVDGAGFPRGSRIVSFQRP